MVSQTLLSTASRRTGYRTQLLEAPVAIIARRHREGQSVAQIAGYLRGQLGAENKVTERPFVAWVIAAVERGEA